MGGKSSVVNKPLGKVGDKALGKNNFINKAANVGLSAAATGGLSLYTNPNSPISARAIIRNVGEGLGEITGANALRKQAMDQQQAAEELAKKQADISDALARSEGGDATSIFIGGGKRRRGAGGGGTGSAGTGNSKDTGVQSY